MSEKNGMTSAMTNATIQVTAMIAAQVAQPSTVLECRWRESRPKMRKKTKRVETDYVYGWIRRPGKGDVSDGERVMNGRESTRRQAAAMVKRRKMVPGGDMWVNRSGTKVDGRSDVT